MESCRKKAMNLRPTYYKSLCLRTSRPACNSAQHYDAIMSAHVLMMALLKSEKIQVCLKAWTPVWQLPQGLLHTPGWWNSDMRQKKQIPSQWGGRGHLHWMFTPSFKINKYFKTIIMKKKQAWTYWSDFLRTLNVKITSWLSKFNNTWQMTNNNIW